MKIEKSTTTHQFHRAAQDSKTLTLPTSNQKLTAALLHKGVYKNTWCETTTQIEEGQGKIHKHNNTNAISKLGLTYNFG